MSLTCATCPVSLLCLGDGIPLQIYAVCFECGLVRTWATRDVFVACPQLEQLRRNNSSGYAAWQRQPKEFREYVHFKALDHKP